MEPEELLRKLQNIASSEKYDDVQKYDLHIKLIRQAKDEWCKKQRENCADEFALELNPKEINMDGPGQMNSEQVGAINGIRHNILNAPEP